MKKAKLNIENIFIFISIVFISTLIINYSYRLVHYYLLENKKVTNITDLYKAVTAKYVKVGDGLYKENNSYYFKGKNVSNYVLYSNMLFRITNLEDNKITLIMDKPIINLYFDNDYQNSIVNEFLTSDLYKVMNNEKIVNTKTCINDLFNEVDDCNKTYENTLVLPSLSLYKKTGSKDSFMNNGYYSYLSNGSSSKFYYLDDKGYVGNTSDKHLYGIKPLITINTSTIIRGNGTENNPYIIENPKTNLKDAFVGSYVYYSNKLWRITKNSDESVKLILNETLNNFKLNYENYSLISKIGTYLNGEFLSTLDKTNMVKGTWYNGTFDNNTKNLFTKTTAYVGLPYIFELFINDLNDYVLMNVSKYNEVIYKIKNNGITYQNTLDSTYSIRPMIYIKNDLKITGLGTINSPYMIGSE